MRPITLQIHPLTLALIIALAIPTVAIAAGTILSPPVTITGSSTGALLTSTNNGKGTAIIGKAAQGRGILGQTAFNSTSNANRESGVVGEDRSTNGTFNAGIRGTSNVGTGVAGISVSGNGILGQTSQNSLTNPKAGVEGDDLSTIANNNNSGVKASSLNGSGLIAISANFIGVAATGNSIGVLSHGGGANGYGLQAYGTGTGVYASAPLVGLSAFSNATAIYAYGAEPNPGATPVVEVVSRYGQPLQIDTTCTNGNSSCNDVASLDSSGNLILNGNLTVDGTIFDSSGSVSNCSPCPPPLMQVVKQRNSGNLVATYVPEQTLPTLDDVGEAQLASGRCFVELDPAFVSLIKNVPDYLVFVTPEGESRGLYVANKTLRGFNVIENDGGRSSISFSYRIVAEPWNTSDARLPQVPPTVGHLARHRKLPSPMHP